MVPEFKQQGAPPAEAGVWLTRLEWLAAILVVLTATLFHIRFVTEVGGLWRDETNSINLATLPTFAELWRLLDYDSFPVLYFAVLRVWAGIFGAGNDEALRALGLLIGLGVLGALWANARAFGSRLPILSLALVGLNPMIVRYGDSNRAYGLGILLILLTLRSFWRLVEQPVRPAGKRIAFAAIFAVLSVQCLYYNSVLLLAIAAGAVAVAFRARAWRTISIILGIGALAAASLLPYVPIIIRTREWTFLVSHPATFSWLWTRAGEVMGAPDPLLIWLWVALVLLGLGWVGTVVVRSFWQGSSVRLPAPVLFAAVTLVVGFVAYSLFLRALNYYTRPWYYITLFAFLACALDAVFGAWPLRASPAWRALRPLVALVLLSFTVPMSWNELLTRHTNVDLVAAQIEAVSRPGDVVLVPRWECAITFRRYYHGKADVITIPPIEDHRVHRYDLVLKQMKTPDADQPVLDRMEKVLRSGHRVFFADTLPFETSIAPLPNLFPPYQDAHGGWHRAQYISVWKQQAGRFLRAHATGVTRIPVTLPPGSEVQKFERLDPGVVEGWQ